MNRRITASTTSRSALSLMLGLFMLGISGALLVAGCANSDTAETSLDSNPSTTANTWVNNGLADRADDSETTDGVETDRVENDEAPNSTLTTADVIANGSPATAITQSTSDTLPPAKGSVTQQTTTRLTTATTLADTKPTSPTPSKPNPSTTKAATAKPSTPKPSTTSPTTTTKPTTTKLLTTRPPSGAFLTVDFQGSPTGEYTDARIRADWGSIRYTKTGGRAAITTEGSNRFLRVKFPKGQVGNGGGGAMWDANLGSNSGDELYASYRVRFVGNFDPVLGGKLPGLSGGTSNGGGDKPNGNDGWSARIMWRRDNAAVQYVYHPDQPSKWGEDLQWGRSFPKNQWITVETRVKMNTPGKRDGVVQSWMDGQLALSRSNLRFRDSNSFGIDRFLFNTFFGGSGSEWAPTKEEHIDFDDFMISQSPITH